LEILEEEAILEWGKKPSKKYVSKEESKEILTMAEPLLKWLREAEEESEEEEEEDQVTFEDNGSKATANKHGASTNGTAPPACNGTTKAAGEKDEEDLNIDEI